MSSLLGNLNVGFLGTGNMNQAIISAILQGGLVDKKNIFASNRTPGKLKKVVESFGIQPVSSNEELVDQCEIVVVGVKPQDLEEALEPIASSFDESQLVISLAAGISLRSLTRIVNQPRWVRVMPNTAAHVKKSVVGYCLSEQAQGAEGLVEDLLSPLGLVIQVEEGQEFEALTVSCGSGIGFVFELMIYWQEWLEEHGFSASTAKQMTLQTFLGAAALAQNQEGFSLTELQKKVVSKKGVTAAGLQSMQELEVERALRYSFEKAVLRDRELGKM